MSLPVEPGSRRETAYVTLLLGVALWLRLWGLQEMEFKADEMESLNLGMRILDTRPWFTGARFPQVGLISSGGLYNPPLYNWVMALFWALTGDPVGATACVALVNVVSLWPLHRWARRHFPAGTALLVLAWCAVSPFAVFYSRKLWPPELLLPGLVALLWAVDWLREGPFWRGVALLLAGMTVLFHLHLSGPVLGVCFVASAAWCWRADRQAGRPWKLGKPKPTELAVLLGIAGLGLLVTVPYVQYLASLSAQAFQGARKNAWPWPEFLVHLARTVLPMEVESHFTGHASQFLHESSSGWLAWVGRRYGLIVGTLTALPLLAAGADGWLRRPGRVPVLGAAWWGFVVLFTLPSFRVYPQYVLVLAPLPALLVAGAFDDDAQPPRWLHALRVVHVVALGALTAGSVAWVTGRGGSLGDYGAGYARKRAQAEAMLAHVQRRTDVPTSDPAGITGLPCHPPNWEIDWIARRLARPEDKPRLRGAVVCDRWTERDGVSVYEWSVPPPPAARTMGEGGGDERGGGGVQHP